MTAKSHRDNRHERALDSYLSRLSHNPFNGIARRLEFSTCMRLPNQALSPPHLQCIRVCIVTAARHRMSCCNIPHGACPYISRHLKAQMLPSIPPHFTASRASIDADERQQIYLSLRSSHHLARFQSTAIPTDRTRYDIAVPASSPASQPRTSLSPSLSHSPSQTVIII